MKAWVLVLHALSSAARWLLKNMLTEHVILWGLAMLSCAMYVGLAAGVLEFAPTADLPDVPW